MALWLYGSLFVHENGREVFFMAMTTRMMIYAFLLYGGIFCRYRGRYCKGHKISHSLWH